MKQNNKNVFDIKVVQMSVDEAKEFIQKLIKQYRKVISLKQNDDQTEQSKPLEIGHLFI